MPSNGFGRASEKERQVGLPGGPNRRDWALFAACGEGISYLRERKDRDSGGEKWQAALGEKGKLHKSPAGDGIG